MSLLLILVVSAVIGALGAYLLKNDLWVASLLAALVGALCGGIFGYIVAPPNQSFLTVSWVSALFTIIGALIAVLLVNLLASKVPTDHLPKS